MDILNWVKNLFRGEKMKLDEKDLKPDSLFNTTVRQKQEDYMIWYLGDSDKLIKRYIDSENSKSSDYEEFRNTKDYFWAIASKERNVKCTHSSIPRIIVQTLVRLLGIPSFKIIDENGEEKTTDIERLEKILDENNFYDVLKQEQEPLTMVIGDGVYLINIDRDYTDLPIIEYIDGRNCIYEWKANKIVAVIVRRFFIHENKGYCLFEKRGTRVETDPKTQEKKRKATIEYSLYTLKNPGTEEVDKEVDLKTIPQTEALENLEFNHIDVLLAVPTIYDLDVENKRGISIFAGKLDLFDDLDQNLSQSSNTVRLSTPVEYFPEGLSDRNSEGKLIAPNRYDRRYISVPSDRNSVGQNVNKVETTQPELNFDKYNSNALEILHNILSGLMSPATLGIDLARDDNATAQREKEKVTLVTRDYIVDRQMKILSKLYNLVLKVHDFMQSSNSKVGDYHIFLNYPEYANPTFDAKISALIPALSVGGISPERYVEELWGDSLSEEDKQKEIEYIISRQTIQSIPEEEPLDLLSFEEAE